mgnify:CR=1 FL=1
MHKPYTKQAQKVIELTTKAARSMHHNYIGTEHILLSLLKERESYAVRFLNANAEFSASRSGTAMRPCAE